MRSETPWTPEAPARARLGRHRLGFGIVPLALATLTLANAAAQTEGPPQSAQQEAPLIRVTLKDGSVLVGRIQAESEEQIEMITPGGASVRIPRSSVVSLESHEVESAPTSEAAPLPLPVADPDRHGKFSRRDPNHTRLLFAPTGRPLGKGVGQFSDYFVLFPGFAYGLTGNLSIMGGVSVIPGVGLQEQLFYVAPRLAFQPSRRTAFSTGVLYGAGGEGSDRAGAGIAFAVGTYGEPHASFSAGIGYGFITEKGEFDLADKPILMLGGEKQVSDSLALLAESWLILDLEASAQPLGLALRFFGDRISVDVGLILSGDILEEGFPVPWLSFSYRFGSSERPSRAKLSRPSGPLLSRLR